MSEAAVRVFFYGSFINLGVLAQVDLVPGEIEVARLPGWDIRIGPLANIERSDRHAVYGIVCRATHAELARLYGQAWVGTYLPEAVVVETSTGALLPALCYVSPPRPYERPDPAYVERIASAAAGHGFPGWYVARIRQAGTPEA